MAGASRARKKGSLAPAYLGAVAVAAVSHAASGVPGSRARTTARTQPPHAAPSGTALASGGGENGKGKERVQRERREYRGNWMEAERAARRLLVAPRGGRHRARWARRRPREARAPRPLAGGWEGEGGPATPEWEGTREEMKLGGR